jgi:hypothetical protein
MPSQENEAPRDRSLEAYYYSFNHTGNPQVDAILAAVAWAGRAYHHTEDWNETDFVGESESHVDKIQKAANEAAATIARLTEEIARLRSAFILSHNGDLQIKWNPDGFWAYGRDRDQSLVKLAGPCDEAIEAALTALAALTPAAENGK